MIAWKCYLAEPEKHVRAVVLQQALLSYRQLLESGESATELMRAYGIKEGVGFEQAPFLDQHNPLTLTRRQIDRSYRSRFPDLMAIHGAEDKHFPCKDHTQELVSILMESGLSVQSHFLKGIGHDTFILGEVLGEAIARFFLKAFGLTTLDYMVRND